MMRRLAREEDLLRGQLGGAVAGALRVAAEIKQGWWWPSSAIGDRYLSTGVFSDEQG